MGSAGAIGSAGGVGMPEEGSLGGEGRLDGGAAGALPDGAPQAGQADVVPQELHGALQVGQLTGAAQHEAVYVWQHDVYVGQQCDTQQWDTRQQLRRARQRRRASA